MQLNISLKCVFKEKRKERRETKKKKIKEEGGLKLLAHSI